MTTKTRSGTPPQQATEPEDLAAVLREGGPEPLMYRVGEVARMMRLSPAKIYEMAAAKSLPSIKVGRAVRIPAAGLRRWLQANTRETE